jgi:hypothetical protein
MAIVLNSLQSCFIKEYSDICERSQHIVADQIFQKRRRSGRSTALAFLLTQICFMSHKRLIIYTYDSNIMAKLQQSIDGSLCVILNTRIFFPNGSTIDIHHPDEENKSDDRLQPDLIVLDGVNVSSIPSNTTVLCV